jgi:DNA-binding NarL/FixJ family response regulator
VSIESQFENHLTRLNEPTASAVHPALARARCQEVEVRPCGDRPEELLSPRELEVLTIIAEGATNAEIAKRLVIAESTVQSHVKHVLEKLGAKNRTQAAARYLRY